MADGAGDNTPGPGKVGLPSKVVPIQTNQLIVLP
jgi:hypothetical protein